jgi:hypothetical protein
MATTTAIILIGNAHQNDSGINPTHFIRFTENSRSALILQPLQGNNAEPKIIIPTIEDTINDIYLTIAVFILGSIQPSKQLFDSEKRSLNEIFEDSERHELYNETLKVFHEKRIKIVFNILDGSSLLHHVETIKKFPNDFEITLPAVKKEFNVWSNKIISKGI